MTPQELVTALQQKRDAMPDPIDLPRTMTQREVDAHEERRAVLNNHAQAVQNSLVTLNAAEGRLSAATANRDRMLVVEATLEKQLAEAPDGRGLADSLHALRHGVQYLNGEPLLPGLLRQALTDTCPTCGHSHFSWPGPLDALNAEVAAAEKKVRELRASFDANVRSAEQLLEPVPA